MLSGQLFAGLELTADIIISWQKVHSLGINDDGKKQEEVKEGLNTQKPKERLQN